MGVQLEIPRSPRGRLNNDIMLFNGFVESLDRAINRILNDIWTGRALLLS